MATFPQVLLCILAVVAIFIFILATLICCLLRFIGRPDYITASDAAYYDKIDTSNEKSYLLDTAHGMFLECTSVVEYHKKSCCCLTTSS